MRKVEFTNLGVTFIFTHAQSNIEVRKNNRPDPGSWPTPPNPTFTSAGYVSKFRLVDTAKPSGQTTPHKITLEVRYKEGWVDKAGRGELKLGIHDGKNWLQFGDRPGDKRVSTKYEIDDRSKKWHGSWLVEVDLDADPLVAWGP